MGLVLIEGIGLGDLVDVGLYLTDETAPGREVLLTEDPAACEIAGGVLIVQGQTDVSQEVASTALTFGTRAVAAGIDTRDKTYLLSVYDRDGVQRHIVDTLEERTFEIGRPLPQEEAHPRLTRESTLTLFEQLTGIGLADIEDARLTVLRSAQEHDEAPGIPLLRRIFGLRSNKAGYADKPGPPQPARPSDA